MDIKLDMNVCRVCLKSGIGISLFSSENFSDKYRYCTNLRPKQNDGLPETLCSKCVSRLKISYEFKRQSESSIKYLKTFINQVNNDFHKTVSGSTNADVDDEMKLLMEAGYAPEEEDEVEEEEEDSQKHVIDEIHEEQELEVIIPDEKSQNCLKVEILSMSDGEELMLEDHHNDDDDVEEQLIEDKNYKSLEEEIFGEEEHLDEVNEGEEECIYEEDITEDQSLADETYDENHVIYINVADNSEIDIKPKLKRKSEKTSPFKSHYCTKCKKDFSTKTNLIRHLATHNGLRPYTCSICAAGFTQNGSLKQHLRIHTGERPYECKVCQRGFTQSKSLTFHMRRHTGEKPYTCDICGLTFRQRDGLKRHNVAKHSDQETGHEQHVCDICDKILFSKYTLAMHTKKHLGGEEMHKCVDCEKSFASKSSLQNHMRQHTGERPYECEQCNKSFAQKGSLTAHMKQHLDVKPFQCHLCSRGFIQKHQLVNHVNMHTNQPVKKFQCVKCFKSFAIKRNLLSHLKTHDEEISVHKCDECNIAFSSSRGLKLHRNNQHKELIKDLNNCEFCDTPFVTLSDLNDHILSEHDIIDATCEVCGLNFNSKKVYEDHLEEHEINALE